MKFNWTSQVIASNPQIIQYAPDEIFDNTGIKYLDFYLIISDSAWHNTTKYKGVLMGGGVNFVI